jgi:hypothetical protein
MGPDDLKRLADQADQDGLAAAKRGDTHGAAKAFLEAKNLRATAAHMEAKLPQSRKSGNVHPVQSASLSKSESAVGGDDPLAVAARSAGYSVRTLAQAMRDALGNLEGFRGCSHVTLMKARRGKQAVWRPVAELIEQVTGFKANSKNWPGGIRG